MKPASILAALMLFASPGLAAPQTENAWDCKFTQRTVCGPEGCSPGAAVPIWIYLTPSQNGYYRCLGNDFDNCDRYKAVVTDSGEFKTFTLPNGNAFAKVGPGLKVTEVLTLMDVVYINRGQCIAGPPPLIRVR